MKARLGNSPILPQNPSGSCKQTSIPSCAVSLVLGDGLLQIVSDFLTAYQVTSRSLCLPFYPITSHMGGSICQRSEPLFRAWRANISLSDTRLGSRQTETRCSSPVEYITCQKYLASGECRRLAPVTNSLPSHDGKSGPDRQGKLYLLCEVWQGEAELCVLTALLFTTGGSGLDLRDCATSQHPAAPIRWHWNRSLQWTPSGQARRAGQACQCGWPSNPELLGLTVGPDCHRLRERPRSRLTLGLQRLHWNVLCGTSQAVGFKRWPWLANRGRQASSFGPLPLRAAGFVWTDDLVHRSRVAER